MRWRRNRAEDLERELQGHLELETEEQHEAGLSADSDVMVDQVRSIDNRRFRRVLGQAPSHRLAEIEGRVALLLDLAVDIRLD